MKSERIKLALLASVKGLSGLAMMALLLFLPAGTWAYSGAWLLMAVLFIPMFFIGVVMLVKSPDLLRRRLSAKEKRSTQQGVIRFAGLIFLVGFVLAGLDYRLGWSAVPAPLTYGCALLFLVGYALYGEVMRENVWLSRTIHVDSEQQVVSTGLYGVMRHPMYTATLIMFLSIPLILGSYVSLIVFLFYIPLLVVRIGDEERLLCNELKGYNEYCNRVRWRLIPYVW
jgi:protein-S-isoprenylcysteine O-methyltransferase Ste14